MSDYAYARMMQEMVAKVEEAALRSILPQQLLEPQPDLQAIQEYAAAHRIRWVENQLLQSDGFIVQKMLWFGDTKVGTLQGYIDRIGSGYRFNVEFVRWLTVLPLEEPRK